MNPLLDLLSKHFIAINLEDSVAEVQDFFGEVTFSHFPVVQDSIFIGCISADDIETFEKSKSLLDYRYALEVFFARTNMNWFDVLSIFAQHDTNICPVLDESNNYIGYYEILDIISVFNETPFVKEAGGIIIVEKPVKEYSMSQVAQIVESNNGRLLGLFISEADTELVRITLKTTLGAVNDIIQTFRRYNYTIVSEHQEDAYLSTLKERSDYLDKYLNL
jgi:Mg/Co/Ni transporter MgtE